MNKRRLAITLLGTAVVLSTICFVCIGYDWKLPRRVWLPRDATPSTPTAMGIDGPVAEGTLEVREIYWRGMPMAELREIDPVERWCRDWVNRICANAPANRMYACAGRRISVDGTEWFEFLDGDEFEREIIARLTALDPTRDAARELKENQARTDALVKRLLARDAARSRPAPAQGASGSTPGQR